jgi:hypothetical protein
MTKSIYQVQIALAGSEPKIWRRVLIPSNLLLSDFHYIIQIVMGWTNSHLHQFIKNKMYYSIEMPDDDFWDDDHNIDYIQKKTRISDLLTKEKEKIIYEYDFGDGWHHDIILEKILPVDSKIRYPVCIEGKMHCPPEDCGGVWGYANMLDILKQPTHEEYEEYLEWLGDEFVPEYFDKNEVNKILKGMKY